MNEDTYKTKNCVILGDDTKESKELRTKGGQPILTPVSHFGAGKNIWILKPTGMNRGRGIYVVDNVKELKRIIKQSCVENSKLKQAEEKVKQQAAPSKQKGQIYMPEPPKTMSATAPIVETKTFVIQKYIEQPCLFNNRKFDIRCWVLLNQDMDLYFFK